VAVTLLNSGYYMEVTNSETVCVFFQTSEYIIQAYKYGAFEKIPEFIAFRNRLNSSLHFAQVRTERMLLDLLLEANM